MRCDHDFLKGLMQCASRLGVEFWAKREKRKRERWRRSFYEERPMSTAGGEVFLSEKLKVGFLSGCICKIDGIEVSPN